jgi:hypothetical protein
VIYQKVVIVESDLTSINELLEDAIKVWLIIDLANDKAYED